MIDCSVKHTFGFRINWTFCCKGRELLADNHFYPPEYAAFGYVTSFDRERPEEQDRTKGKIHRLLVQPTKSNEFIRLADIILTSL